MYGILGARHASSSSPLFDQKRKSRSRIAIWLPPKFGWQRKCIGHRISRDNRSSSSTNAIRTREWCPINIYGGSRFWNELSFSSASRPVTETRAIINHEAPLGTNANFCICFIIIKIEYDWCNFHLDSMTTGDEKLAHSYSVIVFSDCIICESRWMIVHLYCLLRGLYKYKTNLIYFDKDTKIIDD